MSWRHSPSKAHLVRVESARGCALEHRGRRLLGCLVVTWVLLLACGRDKDKLIDGRGMPAKLAKVACGSSLEDAVRAYPDVVKSDDDLVRTVNDEKHVLRFKNGRIAAALVFDFSSNAPKSFGQLMQKLESQFGKGTIRDTQEKSIYWELKKGPVERVLLIGDGKSTSLASYCLENPDCDARVSEYEAALRDGARGADELRRAKCASGSGDDFVPVQPVTDACKALWLTQFAAVDHVVDLHAVATRACPEDRIPPLTVSRPSRSIVDVVSRAPTPQDSNLARAVESASAAPTQAATRGSVSAPPSPAALTVESIQALLRTQASAASSSTTQFANTFDARAIAWFHNSLSLSEGRDSIAAAAQAAWGQPAHIDASTPLVDIGLDVAWATALWQVSLASHGVLHVRVTEVIAPTADGPRVIAAAFSVAPEKGAKTVENPPPEVAGGSRPATPETWLTTPLELSKHVADRESTIVVGSDAEEFAEGAASTRKLLGSWKNVKLDFSGNVRIVEQGDARVVLGYARWRGKSTLFRVFAVFAPAEVQGIDEAPMFWELAMAHYSVVPMATGN